MHDTTLIDDLDLADDTLDRVPQVMMSCPCVCRSDDLGDLGAELADAELDRAPGAAFCPCSCKHDDAEAE